MHSFSLFGMTLASSRSFIDRFPMYLDDLAVPIGTIIAALAVGILIERLALRFLYRFFEKRSIAIGRRLIRSLNGIITLWFGLGAFHAVVDDLPLAPTALPGVLHVASALLMLTFAVLVSRVVIALIRSFASHHCRIDACSCESAWLFRNGWRSRRRRLG